MRGLVRVGAAVPSLALGNVKENMKRHLAMMREAKEKHVSIVTFPELSLTGYTCGDLFFQRRLLDDVTDALLALKDEMPEGILAVVGAPLEIEGALYNCAVVLHKGEIISAVPKTFLPNNGEFYEKRWFQSGDARRDASVAIPKLKTDVCRQAIFETEDGVRFGIELCEDLWAPLPPSTMLSVDGAEIILNLSASNELLSKREYRQQLISQQSARCQCGYVYVSAGMGESSSDLVFSGHSVIASCGTVIRESDGYLADNYLMTADIDIDRIRADRMKQSSFADCAAQVRAMWKQEPNILRTMENALLPDDAAPDYHVSKHPFIPSDKASRQLRCAQILAMQATALARRLAVTGGKVVVGISGGLDSTLALLAACKAVDMLHLPRTNILGITMPCFGTTDRTYHNALDLMTSLGVSQREIPIHNAVRQHFADIGHDESDHSVTYENCQARERTQVLMDVANKIGAIVLGTGDLSEIALGWCTYNADHMSMYGVNSGVPKTLVRWVIQTAAENEAFSSSRECLQSILDTPISPELLPPDEKGNILQQTEDVVGPYALHDFFLYYAIRFGYPPKKVFDLCCIAFQDDFSCETILKWLKNFYRRFWTQQFKRNCMPDGVKIGSIALSPRGDWRMPSDAQYKAWMDECDCIKA
ncbi:MAG TPA: NAD(+) synthase [Clostridiales bacterium]|nr:NAD(+) synthase [Clostridiales bacterium]HCV69412.1 NAD(+) synthase [Clostridiales bacterium]